MKPPARYLEVLAQMCRDGVIPRGQVVHVDVEHDAGCSLLNGLMTCDCQPLVTVRPEAA
jgi:hypothetical protein